MKLPRLRQYYGLARDEVSRWLHEDLWNNFVDIQNVMKALSFDDNFEGWIERDLSIPANSQVAIPNRLKPSVPRYRVVLKSSVSEIRDGDTSWDDKNVYLHNGEASTAIVTVAFLK